MMRWILLTSLIFGMGGWLRGAGPDRERKVFGTPTVTAPDVQVMDGVDPFPPH